MRKLNLLSMCFVLMVIKASVTEENADSLSETIKIAAPSSNTRTFAAKIHFFARIFDTLLHFFARTP